MIFIRHFHERKRACLWAINGPVVIGKGDQSFRCLQVITVKSIKKLPLYEGKAAKINLT